MPETFEIEVCGDLIQGKTFGTFSLENGFAFLGLLFRRAREENINKILIDARGISTEVSTMARFELGNYMAEQRAYAIRIALFVEEKQALPDRFLENVARNRGVKVTVFTEREAALQWLAV